MSSLEYKLSHNETVKNTRYTHNSFPGQNWNDSEWPTKAKDKRPSWQRQTILSRMGVVVGVKRYAPTSEPLWYSDDIWEIIGYELCDTHLKFDGNAYLPLSIRRITQAMCSELSIMLALVWFGITSAVVRWHLSCQRPKRPLKNIKYLKTNTLVLSCLKHHCNSLTLTVGWVHYLELNCIDLHCLLRYLSR